MDVTECGPVGWSSYQLKYTGSFVSEWGLGYSLVTVVVTVPVWLQ